MKINTGLLASLFAFSLFFPTVALFNIGPHTGFQLSAFFAILYYLANFRSKVTRSFFIWYSLIFSLIFLQVAYFMINGLDSEIYYKNVIHFGFSVFIIYIGYKIADKNLDAFYQGFLSGALVSGIFGILQYIFWIILKYDFLPLRGINNCNSFANAGLIPNILEFGRIFGFAPESSLYGLLMIAGLVIAINFKKKMHIGILILAIILSMSMSSLLMIIVYLIYRFRKSTVFMIILVLLIIFAVREINTILENVNVMSVSAEVNIIERILNFSNNASFISRMNSIWSATDIILTHPFLGIGYSDILTNTLLENSIESVEANRGINALLFLVLVIFGFPLTLVFLYPLIKASYIKFSDQKYLLFLSYVLTIPSFISVGYYSFYLPWIGIGFASYIVFNLENREFRNKNQKENE